jgi:RNA polymerase sigma factor (sigma-70 family)
MSKLFNKIPIDSEKEIIRKVREGETTLFEVLVRRCNDVLYKIGRIYGFNHHDATDLVQDAHLTAFNELSSFEGLSAYRTWICKIMIRKCLYKLGHGASRFEVPVSGFATSAEPIYGSRKMEEGELKIQNQELARILENSITSLPLPYRAVFVLREIEGLSVAETAELLGLTVVNVKVRLNRAKVMLRKLLEQFYSSTDLFELKLPHCDAITQGVFDQISEQVQ